MHTTLPFYWSYINAFTMASFLGGFPSILIDELVDARKKDALQMQELNFRVLLAGLDGFEKIMQSIAAGSMLQATCLSLGYTKAGLANYKFVILVVPLAIEVLVFLVNEIEAPEAMKQVLNKINTYFGYASMVSLLISSLVIAKKIGFFDLLPLATLSATAYLVYKTIKIYRAYP